MTRRHARIFLNDGQFWVEDLGGLGVWVNGAKVDRCALEHRDLVRIGELELEYFAR